MGEVEVMIGVVQGRPWEILAVGDSSMDLFLQVPQIPGRDHKLLGRLVARAAGGVAANFACAAARFGARTAFAGTVGDDGHGREAAESLRLHGVDTAHLHYRPGGETPWCVVLLDGSGEKALTVVETNCMAPTPDEIDPDLFGQARLVHVSANDPQLAAWVAEEARRRGAMVSVDLEPGGLTDPASLERILANTDLLFPNLAGLAAGAPSELARLAGGDSKAVDAAARRLLQQGPRWVVVTMGARGAMAVGGGEVHRIEAVPVSAVDTTGAGDCFNGCFAASYLQGLPVPECGRLAAGAAAIAIGRYGARGHLPTPGEVRAFLQRRSSEEVRR